MTNRRAADSSSTINERTRKMAYQFVDEAVVANVRGDALRLACIVQIAALVFNTEKIEIMIDQELWGSRSFAVYARSPDTLPACVRTLERIPLTV